MLSTPRVNRESSHFMSVFCQLFVTGHAVSVDYVDDGGLRANPNLILEQSQHAGLHRKMVGMHVYQNWINTIYLLYKVGC